MRSGLFVFSLAISAVLVGLAHAAGDQHQHFMTMSRETAKDDRQLVTYPEALRIKTLANMRDHLLALSEIQAALAKDDFETAAEIAENRLGMNSLSLHGAHEVAPLMPQGMQQAGTALHHAASRFAQAAKDAGVTGDMKAALGALTEVTQTCAACHAGYRLQ